MDELVGETVRLVRARRRFRLAGVAGSGPAADSGGLAVAPGLPSTPGPPSPPPPVAMAASRPWRLAVVAVAGAVAGLAWPAGRDAAPEAMRTAAGTPGGENARGVERGDGGGVGGAGAAGAPPADPAETAQRGAAMDRADSDTEPDDESSAQEDPAPVVPPEAVEAALGLDSTGWLEIQKGLVALGLDPGTLAGRVGGRGTRGAVRAYQEGAGKPATGLVDAADVTTLRYAASEAGRVEEQRLAEEMERQRPAEAAAEAERRRQAELRRPGRVFRDCDSCPELVVIPAGTFQMGSPASEEGRYDNEGPRRRVTLRSFAMGVKEVTFDEWDACVRGGGCYGRPDDEGWGRGARPVINVSRVPRRCTCPGCRRLRGRGIDFRASRSGSMRRVRVRRRLSIRGRRSRRIRRTTTGTTCTAPAVAGRTASGRRPWVRLRRTRSACTTCMATCMNRWRIAGMTTTAEHRRTGRRGRVVETVGIVCCAAVRGSTFRGASVRPSATGTSTGVGSTSPVFACRGRSIEVKSYSSFTSWGSGGRSPRRAEGRNRRAGRHAPAACPQRRHGGRCFGDLPGGRRRGQLHEPFRGWPYCAGAAAAPGAATAPIITQNAFRIVLSIAQPSSNRR